MSTDRKMNTVVVGGSIAGLLCATVLVSAGHSVTVLERTAESRFSDQGSGLGVRGEVEAFFDIYGTTHSKMRLAFGTPHARVLEKDGSVAAELQLPAKSRTTSWAGIVKTLSVLFAEKTAEFGNREEGNNNRASSYIYGAKVVDIQEPEEATTDGRTDLTVTYEIDGAQHNISGVDLVIGADGASSTVRSLMMGSDAPADRSYSGYVCQRLCAPRDAVSDEVHAIYRDAVIMQTNDGMSVTSYWLPSGDANATKHDIMLACYAHYTPEDLKTAMLGADGHQYSLTLPGGQLRPEAWELLKNNVRSKFSPQLQEILDATPRENVLMQAITDLWVGQNCFLGGKVLLVSEAMTVLRPHGFAGIAQSAYHALRLRDYIEGRIDVDEWSRDCLQYSKLRRDEAVQVGGVLMNGESQGVDCLMKQMNILKEVDIACGTLRAKLGK